MRKTPFTAMTGTANICGTVRAGTSRQADHFQFGFDFFHQPFYSSTVTHRYCAGLLSLWRALSWWFPQTKFNP